MQAGKTFSFAFICTHTHTCEVSIKARLTPVSRKQVLRCSAEKQADELFSSSSLSPHLCSACRGVLLKGLPCTEKKKPPEIQSLKWCLQSLIRLHPSETLSFYQVPHQIFKIGCVAFLARHYERLRKVVQCLSEPPSEGFPSFSQHWDMATLLIDFSERAMVTEQSQSTSHHKCIGHRLLFE